MDENIEKRWILPFWFVVSQIKVKHIRILKARFFNIFLNKNEQNNDLGILKARFVLNLRDLSWTKIKQK